MDLVKKEATRTSPDGFLFAFLVKLATRFPAK